MRSTPRRLQAACIATALACASSARAGCLSLRDSQGCPGFANEFISTNATSRFSWYPKDDIAAFDKALSDYVVGRANLDEFQSVFRCPGLDDLGGFSSDHGPAVIRYHRSMVCADVIFSSNNIAECYGDNAGKHRRRDGGGSRHRRRDNGSSSNNKSPELQLAEILASTTVDVRASAPKPLCRSTCEAWIGSLRTIASNTTLCQPNRGINREASLDSLRAKCDMAMYNGAPGHCVDGEANELKTCALGYQRVEDWCKYCDYARDYVDACASVGVRVGEGSGSGSEDGSPNDGGSVSSGDRLLAELSRRRRQERAFRIAAVVLGIAAGTCLAALLALLAVGRRRRRRAGTAAGRPRNESSHSGMDDSTLLQGGANGHEDKAADFLDCFVAVVGKSRTVLHPFFARREDEISLQSGDTVTVQMAFDDGWVVGKNLTSGLEGTFPLMCIMENLPPSLPAHWSVLPEVKNASIENLRSSSRSMTRPTPRPSGAASPPPLGTSAAHSTRTSHIRRRPSDAPRAPGLLARLAAALPFGGLGRVGSAAAGNGGGGGISGLFGSILLSPPRPGAKIGALEISAPIQNPRHSFTVRSAAHIGLDNPHYAPAPDGHNTWAPAGGVPSENRYPVMGMHHDPAQAPPPPQQQLPPAPRQPSNNSQLTVGGNASMETYRTAQQSASGPAGMPLGLAPAYLRQP
ncbi:hypothetical protein H4R18_003171 [Coemansia javaensis]|uniref:SH3 domain-containing protein n=1 Tax=Coemansia javaensis TaxID=2761396 RepID=A0A9W8LJ01_9FUNG|nr:hypothetical protein H4R18_003171 [Coemansia javaensis]